MKIFDSGMPDEAYWNSLFDIPLIVDWLNAENLVAPVVEIGCGYGTFTVPVARATTSEVYAFDMESSMLEIARRNVRDAGIGNVKFFRRDVVEKGTGLASETAGMVLLFNILHFKERRVLLEEAARILATNGVAAVIHWRKDVETPRGPEISSRPDERLILDSASGLALSFGGNSRILEPYHWGMQMVKAAQQNGENT